MKKNSAEILAMIGLALIVAGVARWSVAAAFVVAGAGLIIAGLVVASAQIPKRTEDVS
jgi:hypothetical protein